MAEERDDMDESDNEDWWCIYNQLQLAQETTNNLKVMYKPKESYLLTDSEASCSNLDT